MASPAKRVETEPASVTTHVVLFKFKPEFDAAKEREAAAAAASFVGGIEGVLSVSFGRTFTTEFANGFTHVLVVVFDLPTRLETYGPHPIHKKWAEAFVTPNKLDILKVDIDAPVVSLSGGKM